MVGFGKYIPEGSLETCSYDFLSRDPKVGYPQKHIYEIDT